ncbi:amidohydrolase family protein [Novosphingobium terrae]|uniref:amidohydrolase family protein n=1 Tax=Novosphingobium terrae TaxID=2726189 RepID=UPI00197DFF4D|nr:amidohydrolase family protein [Novosphingobium terrae]
MKRSLLWAGAALALIAAIPAVQAQDTAAPHTLSYKAHEATWSHLSLSPDGQWIWFDLLGDIYRMPASGGTATPVLTGTAYERNPVISPDGQWVAYISDRSGADNLWIARSDGTQARQLTPDTSLALYTSPEWAPDGKSLTYSRAVHSILAFELWRVALDGGKPQRLVAAQPHGNEGWDERINALGAVPTPDGKAVYYATKPGHTWTEADPPNWTIVRRDNATGASEPVIPGGMRPVLSPDGKLLAYAARKAGGQTGLRLRDLTTGEDRWLTWPVDRDGQEGAYYIDLLPRYQFTPDGKSIVMSVDGGFARVDLATGARTPIPFTAPVNLALAPQSRVVQRVEEGPVRSHLAEAATRSPDGKSIAFTALGRLYVADAKGGAPRLLLDGDAFQPAWSHDGKSIALIRWNQQGGGLWSIPAKGGAPRRLTARDGYWREPVMQADGSVIALWSSQFDRLMRNEEIAPAGPTDVVKVSPDGTVSTIGHGMALRHLQQTTDGRIFVQTAEGLSQLADGRLTERASVVAKPMGQYVAGQRPVDELRISPDGTMLAARTAFELHILPMPPAGKPLADLADPASGQRQVTAIGADTMRWDGDGLSWTVGAAWRHAALATLRAAADPEASAQKRDLSITLPRAMPSAPTLLRGATVLTMEQGDKAIEDADLLVVGDRIAALGPRGSFALPKDTRILDETGKFITPGLIDAHAHFFALRRPVQDAQDWQFHADLAYGVTSVLEVQAFTPDIFAYGDRIDAGREVGPRIFSTGPGVFVNSAITSEKVAETVLTRYREAYRTRNIKSYMVGDRAARQAMVAASRKLGMMPTTEGAADYILEMTHAVDGFSGNEHNIPVTPLHDDVLRLFVASGISYNPTLTVLYGGQPMLPTAIQTQRPEDEARLKAFMPPEVMMAKLRSRHWTPEEWLSATRFAADATRLHRMGGLVGIGSHGEMQGIGMHWEMAAMVAGGAKPIEALAMATRDNATIIGRPADIGTVSVGKLADLLVLEGDPRLDIANARKTVLVMRGGIGFDPLTLTRDDGAALPAPWWQRHP